MIIVNSFIIHTCVILINYKIFFKIYLKNNEKTPFNYNIIKMGTHYLSLGIGLFSSKIDENIF